MRVIDQAFRDLGSPTGSRADHDSARDFLAGSSMLHHWCQVADVDPAWMITRAKVLIEEGQAPRGVRRARRVISVRLAED
jgi:hypothetical protein